VVGSMVSASLLAVRTSPRTDGCRRRSWSTSSCEAASCPPRRATSRPLAFVHERARVRAAALRPWSMRTFLGSLVVSRSPAAPRPKPSLCLAPGRRNFPNLAYATLPCPARKSRACACLATWRFPRPRLSRPPAPCPKPLACLYLIPVRYRLDTCHFCRPPLTFALVVKTMGLHGVTTYRTLWRDVPP